MFYNRYSQNAYSVPGPVLVSGDGMVSRAALLWLLRLGPGSKADQCAGGCLDAYMSLGAIYVHHLPGPSSLGCMWQDVVFGAVGCLHLALSSPSSVVTSVHSRLQMLQMVTKKFLRASRRIPLEEIDMASTRPPSSWRSWLSWNFPLRLLSEGARENPHCGFSL